MKAESTDGRPSAPMYEVRFTRQFVRATKKLNQAELKAACEKISQDPYNALGAEPLSYEWAGFRAADFTRKERIIYRICEECVEKHQEDIHPLGCCSRPDDPKNVVTFVDFGDYHASAGRRRLTPNRSYDIPAEDDSRST